MKIEIGQKIYHYDGTWDEGIVTRIEDGHDKIWAQWNSGNVNGSTEQWLPSKDVEQYYNRYKHSHPEKFTQSSNDEYVKMTIAQIEEKLGYKICIIG